MPAHRIGTAVGVSESTVVRLATRLGYDGFPDLQLAMQRSLDGEDPGRLLAPPTGRTSETTASMLGNDTANLSALVTGLRGSEVIRAVDLLSQAETIYVIGFRTSFSLAFLASFLLKQVHRETRLVGDTGGDLPDDIAGLSAGDVLVAFSFPRYVRRTVAVADYAMSQGIATIAVTDSLLSPLARSTVVFPVSHDTSSFFNSNVAATALINVLVAEVCARVGSWPDYDGKLVESFYEMVEPIGAPNRGE